MMIISPAGKKIGLLIGHYKRFELSELGVPVSSPTHYACSIHLGSSDHLMGLGGKES